MTKFIATAKFSSLRIREATSIPMLDSAIPVSSTAPRKLSQSPKLKLTLKTQASGVRTMAKKRPIRGAAREDEGEEEAHRGRGERLAEHDQAARHRRDHQHPHRAELAVLDAAERAQQRGEEDDHPDDPGPEELVVAELAAGDQGREAGADDDEPDQRPGEGAGE